MFQLYHQYVVLSAEHELFISTSVHTVGADLFEFRRKRDCTSAAWIKYPSNGHKHYKSWMESYYIQIRC